MAEAQHDCYISKQSKEFGEMNQIIIKGNKLKHFKLDNYIVLVWSRKHYTEKQLVNRLFEAIKKKKEKD